MFKRVDAWVGRHMNRSRWLVAWFVVMVCGIRLMFVGWWWIAGGPLIAVGGHSHSSAT